MIFGLKDQSAAIFCGFLLNIKLCFAVVIKIISVHDALLYAIIFCKRTKT